MRCTSSTGMPSALLRVLEMRDLCKQTLTCTLLSNLFVNKLACLCPRVNVMAMFIVQLEDSFDFRLDSVISSSQVKLESTDEISYEPEVRHFIWSKSSPLLNLLVILESSFMT